MNDKTQLSLKGKGLKNLDFLSKFMRENPQVQNVDIGDNPLSNDEVHKFYDKNLTRGTGLQTIGITGIKSLKSSTRSLIQKELQKNRNIKEMIKSSKLSKETNQLTLKDQKIKHVGFLNKFLASYNELKILDLSDNKLGNRGAIEITQLIESTTTIEELTLCNNKIGPSGLQHICSALVVNKSIKKLDI